MWSDTPRDGVAARGGSPSESAPEREAPHGEFIPLSVPALRGNESEYLAECIAGGWVSSVGPFVTRFERDAAAWLGARHAVAAASGTAALHLGLLVAGVLAGDEVLVSNLTFIAPANAIRYVNAVPVFIGSEADYWQIDPQLVRAFLQDRCERRAGGVFNRQSGRRVRALVAVHILGHSVQLRELAEIASEYGLILIEDCAEAMGTQYEGQPVGRHGAVAAFSFNGNKIMTCGGGGLLITHDEMLAERARHLSTQAKSSPHEYEHDQVGYNYRLTNLQAAVGCAQLEQLDGFVTRKRAIAARYREAFAGAEGLRFMKEPPWSRSTYWLSTILVDAHRFGLDSRGLMRRLEGTGMQSRPLWQPMHRSQAHREAESFGCEVDDLLWRDALSLPSSPDLGEESQERVIREVIAAGRGATRA